MNFVARVVLACHFAVALVIATLANTCLATLTGPTLMDFGPQSVNTTSLPHSFTLLNATTSTVTVTAIAIQSGYNADEFPFSHNCSSLPPAGTCVVTMRFVPGSAGYQVTNLVVSNSGGDITIKLQGMGEASLVVHYYQAILRRDPDPSGKSYWDGEASRMQNLGADRREVAYTMAMSFFTSAEYLAVPRDDAGFAQDMYATFLNRAPDSGGLAGWLSQLSSGLPREVMIASFMFSPEFITFSQTVFTNAVNVRSEINTTVDFYRGLLSRLPDDGGFGYWLHRLRIAQCVGQSSVLSQVDLISSQFINSPEYIGRQRTNSQFIGDLYNAFLRRGGDLSGVLFWIGQLSNGVLTRDQVRQYFMNSPEFTGRVSALIADGCVSGTCGVTLAPSSDPAFTYHGGNSAFGVTTDPGCTWTVSTGIPWLHVLSGTPGNGPGIVQYSVDPYPVVAGGTRYGTFVVNVVSGGLGGIGIRIDENGIPTNPPPITNPCYPNCQSNGYCCAPGLVGCNGACYVSNTAAYTATGNPACLSVVTICSQ
jgi:hypothetical protein